MPLPIDEARTALTFANVCRAAGNCCAAGCVSWPKQSLAPIPELGVAFGEWHSQLTRVGHHPHDAAGASIEVEALDVYFFDADGRIAEIVQFRSPTAEERRRMFKP